MIKYAITLATKVCTVLCKALLTQKPLQTKKIWQPVPVTQNRHLAHGIEWVGPVCSQMGVPTAFGQERSTSNLKG